MTVNYFFTLFQFVSFLQTSEYFRTWGSTHANLHVKCVGTVRAASYPPVWIHRECELLSLKNKEWWSMVKRAGGSVRDSTVPVPIVSDGQEHTLNRDKDEIM